MDQSLININIKIVELRKKIDELYSQLNDVEDEKRTLISSIIRDKFKNTLDLCPSALSSCPDSPIGNCIFKSTIDIIEDKVDIRCVVCGKIG